NLEENNVTAYDLDYIITPILDLDFNSLYPSAFCGIYNKNNLYTGGMMYMVGRVTKHIKVRESNDQEYRDNKRKEMMNIINSEDRFSEEKGYYLWLLIDYCHFIIDVVDEIVLFTKHTAFKSFVEIIAEKRYQAMKEGNQAKQLYFKNIVNSSHGADGQNNEKFDKIGIYNKQYTFLKQLNKGFTITRKICDDRYLVSINPDSFSAHKCSQESIFTQDNSKFWYLCFIYFFLYKCIDMNRVHFCCMDTDSMYLAISDSTIEGYKQQFKHVIKDQKFWDEHCKKWLPWDGCTITEEKKLLGCAIESQREISFAQLQNAILQLMGRLMMQQE
ncbi:MAG: hypothetical protein EZS28_015125, partial [Streblomastix strix]